MKKWEEVQELVNEALNTRRNDCTSAMKKKFIGKIFCIANKFGNVRVIISTDDLLPNRGTLSQET